MIELNFYVSLQVTIVGVGLPILLQVISRLDNKYNSTSILDLFKREMAAKVFLFALAFALISTILWSLRLKPRFEPKTEWINTFIGNSAEIFVAFFSTLLLVAFLWVFYVVYSYYTYEQLVPHLLKSKKQANIRNQALRDLLLFLLVTKGKENLLVDIRSNFDEKFRDERVQNANSMIEYSPVLSDVIIKVSQVQNSRNENSSHQYSSCNLSSAWLISESNNFTLSDSAYRQLWTILSFSINEGNAELFMDHWKRADSIVISMDLKINSLDYLEKVDHTNILRNKKLKFIRFHHSIGGLLLFKMQYKMIDRMFRHTTSEPYQYNLLPKTMTEICDYYKLTRVRSPLDYDETSIYFRFPGTDGIRSESLSIKYISRYTALLFIRQYTITGNYGMDPLDHPRLPNEQREIQIWIEGLSFFKKLVADLLEHDELFEALEFNRYSQLEDKPAILRYLDTMEETIKVAFSQMKIREPLDESKISQFTSRSKEIVEKELDRINDNLNTLEAEDQEYNTNMLDGLAAFKLHKDAFIKKSLVHDTNFDSFTAGSSISQIEGEIQNEFYKNSGVKYKIDERDIKIVLNKLQLNADHVILNLGLNIDYYLYDNELNRRDEKFQNLEIRELKSRKTYQKGIYILRKSDLPILFAVDFDDEEKSGLNELSKKYFSYWKINESDDPNIEAHNLMVDVVIYLRLKIKWKTDLKMIYVRVVKQYELSGDETKPDTVKPF